MSKNYSHIFNLLDGILAAHLLISPIVLFLIFLKAELPIKNAFFACFLIAFSVTLMFFGFDTLSYFAVYLLWLPLLLWFLQFGFKTKLKIPAVLAALCLPVGLGVFYYYDKCYDYLRFYKPNGNNFVPTYEREFFLGTIETVLFLGLKIFAVYGVITLLFYLKNKFFPKKKIFENAPEPLKFLLISVSVLIMAALIYNGYDEAMSGRIYGTSEAISPQGYITEAYILMYLFQLGLVVMFSKSKKLRCALAFMLPHTLLILLDIDKWPFSGKLSYSLSNYLTKMCRSIFLYRRLGIHYYCFRSSILFLIFFTLFFVFGFFAHKPKKNLAWSIAFAASAAIMTAINTRI